MEDEGGTTRHTRCMHACDACPHGYHEAFVICIQQGINIKNVKLRVNVIVTITYGTISFYLI